VTARNTGPAGPGGADRRETDTGTDLRGGRGAEYVRLPAEAECGRCHSGSRSAVAGVTPSDPISPNDCPSTPGHPSIWLSPPVRARWLSCLRVPAPVTPCRYSLPRFRAGSANCSPTMRGLVAKLRPYRLPHMNARRLSDLTIKLFEWVLPPLVISPVRAHAEALTLRGG